MVRHVTTREFERMNLRIGKIKGVKKHPKIEEYILLIDLGPVEQDMQLVADLKPYTMKELIGKQVVFLENMKPQKVRGVSSQGMLLITHKNNKPVLLSPEKKVATGVKVYGVNDSERCHYREIGK